MPGGDGTEPNLDDQVEARLGNSACFLIVDTKKRRLKNAMG